jgi:mono/diheme cytochrome c family protein
MIRFTIGLVSACAIAVAAAAAAPRDVAPIIARGAQVAQERCAACHAVALEEKSPSHDAPLFRVLSRLYSASDLRTKLTDISDHGHFEMPPLTLREDEIADVAAYIASLDGGGRRGPRARAPVADAGSRRGEAAQWITSAANRSISSY